MLILLLLQKRNESGHQNLNEMGMVQGLWELHQTMKRGKVILLQRELKPSFLLRLSHPARREKRPRNVETRNVCIDLLVFFGSLDYVYVYLSSIIDVSPSERRRLQRIAEKNANTTCFACREKGHAARDCPTNENGDAESKPVGMCYRCVSLSHSPYSLVFV